MTDNTSGPIAVDLAVSGGPLSIQITESMVDAFGWGYDFVEAKALRPIRPGSHRRMGLMEAIPAIQHATLHALAQMIASSIEPANALLIDDEEREFFIRMANVVNSMGCNLFDEFLTKASELRDEYTATVVSRPEPGGYL